MILRIILKNFLSFDDEVQFDMLPNMKRTSLSNHILMAAGKLPVLKMAAIYGSNGAGKSNLVKALEFIRAFALDKNFIKNIELQKFFYLLKEDAMEDPMYLAIEFENQNKFFFYEIEISKTAIVRECLSETFPFEGRMERIFERKKLNVKLSEGVSMEDAIADATKRLLAKNSQSSLLSLNGEFPIIPDPRCKFAAKWLKGQLEIIGVHSFLPTLIELLRDNKPMMEFARKLINGLELGINDVNLSESDFDQWAKNHMELASSIPGDIDKVKSLSLNANNTPVLAINVEEGIRKVYQLIFDNVGKQGYVGHLDTSLQSDGTLRALTLLPALYYASVLGKTVVVDEINCCLSPTMVKGIVEFFSKTDDVKGQLIFTTHEEQLLDEREILRSDEIWFVDKREGASIVYSHNDFKEHHTISPMRGYKEGRYGAIRYINLLKEDE